MEAIRKQASKLREQVARQQQAVLKQFGAGGYGGSDNMVTDQAELQQHHKLDKLYISTRAAKHYQRDIVRGVEGYIVNGSKQVEIGTKLSEDSRKYGAENTCTSGSTLSRAALNYARSRAQMEKERGNLLKALGTQLLLGRIQTKDNLRMVSDNALSRSGINSSTKFVHVFAMLIGCAKGKRQKEGLVLIWNAFMWVVWKVRNDRIFNNGGVVIDEIVDKKLNLFLGNGLSVVQRKVLAYSMSGVGVKLIVSVVEYSVFGVLCVLWVLWWRWAALFAVLWVEFMEPLRAMVMGAPLEDARHLAQRYDRMRQDAEAQAIEVSKRQAKVRETPGNAENAMKLEASETKLQDLKANMAILGKEAAAAMTAVEAQQQRLTLQRLIAMVEAERAYHQRVLQILDHLEGEASDGISSFTFYSILHIEMISERQRIEAPPTPSVDNSMPPPPSYKEVNGVYASQDHNDITDSMGYFLGEVTPFLVLFPYHAESEVELNLSVGDYIVIRKVTNNGWAEGECKGKAGWFPFGYVERRDRVLASKVAEVF
ncbi:SH3 domain protein [Trifolium pratense]|uniref:SH3 domain protein n=2 Tax=Trifolium TaxID=3898 RepID=A0A2K3PAP8_TRIPR|nr:SH3 domain protein [Trifolium pratense]